MLSVALDPQGVGRVYVGKIIRGPATGQGCSLWCVGGCSVVPAGLAGWTGTRKCICVLDMEWLRKYPRTVDVKTADGVVRGSLLRDREFQEAVAVFK